MRKHLSRALIGALVWTASFGVRDASAAGRGRATQFGAHYYAIVNLDVPDAMAADAVILRGLTGSAGKAHDGLIVRPLTNYREWILNPRNMRVAVADFFTPPAGNRFKFPTFNFEASGSPDTDNDGVHDLGEFIVGTNRNDADSDDDGIRDGAELVNGTNPLDGFIAAVGIVGAQDTPGTAYDIAAGNGLAAIADSTAGVVLFEVANASRPVRAAQVDTPGDARAIAFGGGLLAAADGTPGLVIIEVSDPPAARILHVVRFGGVAVNAVTTDGPLAYIGLADGSIASVDLLSGLEVQRRDISNLAIQDVVLGQEALHALVAGTLYTIDLRSGDLDGALVSLASPGGVGAGQRRLRLSPGGDRLYASFTSGINVFSLANPQVPTLLKTNNTAQQGWKQLVPNGSGLGVAAVSPNSTDDGPHDISLYTLLGDGSMTFNTTIVTPGLATAVAIHNGLAYIADGTSGLQIANYLAYDALGQPPTVALSASFPLSPAQAEEGKRVRITAAVTDDVQVRNVEFLVDGAVVANDGGFPFELRFTTPSMSPTKTSFTLQARAFDTGGNVATTSLLQVALVPDATQPFVKRTAPANNALLGQVSGVLVFFSEPIKPATLTSTSLLVRGAGADGLYQTADDPVLPAGTLIPLEELNAARINFASTLPTGEHRIEAKIAITDLAGNPLAADYQSVFTVLGFVDQDEDGVSDVLEAAIGLNPSLPDTDGDGILDGLEDYDGDGLTNALESVHGTNLASNDTDFDGLLDGPEVNGTTSPTDADSDDDGWSDGEETKDGTNPLLASSTPSLTTYGRPVVHVELTSAEEGLASPVGAVISRPVVAAENSAAEEGLSAPQGAVIARPVVEASNVTSEEGLAAPQGAVIGRPVLEVENSAAEEGQSAPAGAVINKPVVTIQLPSS